MTVVHGLLAAALYVAYRGLAEAIAPSRPPVLLLLVFLTLAVPVGLLALTVDWRWSRPAALLADPGRPAFTAPMVAPGAAIACVSLMWLSARTALWSGGPEARWEALIFTSVLLAAALVVLVRFGSGDLVLTPKGIGVKTLTGYRHVAWESIAGIRQARGGLRVDREGSQFWVPLSMVQADPGSLTAVIDHYARHPAHRCEIGTREELDRLRQLQVPPVGDSPLR